MEVYRKDNQKLFYKVLKNSRAKIPRKNITEKSKEGELLVEHSWYRNSRRKIHRNEIEIDSGIITLEEMKE